MIKKAISRQARIDSRIIKHHMRAINQTEDAMITAMGRELVLLGKSRDYHIARLQKKWYGDKYNVDIV